MSTRALLAISLFMIVTPLQATIKQKGVGNAPTSTKSSTPYRKIHSLFIGINDYAERSIADLEFAENDATGMHQFLTSKFGFSPQDSTVLTGSLATKSKIEAALERLCDPAIVKPEDAVFVFLSGHGVTVQRSKSKRGWFVAQDSQIRLSSDNATLFDSQCIAFSRVSETLGLSPARHLVVIADSCFAGNLVKGKGNVDFLAENFTRIGREVLAATSSSKTAAEDTKQKHGVFTGGVLAAFNESLAKRIPFTLESILESAREYSSTPTQSPIYGDWDTSEGGRFVFFPAGSKLEDFGRKSGSKDESKNGSDESQSTNAFVRSVSDIAKACTEDLNRHSGEVVNAGYGIYRCKKDVSGSLGTYLRTKSGKRSVVSICSMHATFSEAINAAEKLAEQFPKADGWLTNQVPGRSVTSFVLTKQNSQLPAITIQASKGADYFMVRDATGKTDGYSNAFWVQVTIAEKK